MGIVEDIVLGEIIDATLGRVVGMPNDMTPWYGDVLSAITPDALYRYDWEEPQALQGELARAAGIDPSSVGTGWLGEYGTSGAKRDRYVTTIQRIKPTGVVETVDVFKGKPLLTRNDIATVRKVKKTTAKLKRWFPTKCRKTTRRRR